jgi:signal-transduction protein with cAMP-binding, CBS, and nucleotidyltransferase domain
MKIQDIMIRDVVQAKPDEPVGEAVKRMCEKAVGCLVVTISGSIKGILTDRDLLTCISEGHNPHHCKVSAHMHRPVVVLPPEEDHMTAIKVLRERNIRRLPVAHSGKLLGIISLSDLVWLAGQEILKIRSSLDYFAEIVNAQSVQHSLGQATPATEPPAVMRRPVPEAKLFGNGTIPTSRD